MSDRKKHFLKEKIKHIDVTLTDMSPVVDQMADMAYQARNLANAARISKLMVDEKECAVILTLAGSLISAGLKKAIVDLMKRNMIDAIVSTGANIVDQDFFEGLGFSHYKGSQFNNNDDELRQLAIDRIYDTYIDEDDLRICDDTIEKITNSLEPRPYSSRQFIVEMGKYLKDNNLGEDSITRTAYEMGVPIFVPAFSDCSAGFGLVAHQWKNPEHHVTIDSVRDFRELTIIKLVNPTTGIFMLGGGVPKNFLQDIVVAAEVLGFEADMHKYAIQLTVADERDGALSGSTLKEACSWGKVDIKEEQMVFGELTTTFPMIANYMVFKGQWKNRKGFRFNDKIDAYVAQHAAKQEA